MLGRTPLLQQIWSKSPICNSSLKECHLLIQPFMNQLFKGMVFNSRTMSQGTSSLAPGKQDNTRRCGRGLTNLIWHVTDNVAHLTVPDLTCTIRTDIVTLEGVYQLELNRFDAASRYVRWQQPLETSPPVIGTSHPNAGQKQALCKYLRFMHSHWADTGTTPPGPSSGLAPTGLLPTQGRFPAPLYTSSGLGYPRTRLPYPGNGPYRRPRVVIPVDMGVPYLITPNLLGPQPRLHSI